MLVLLMALTATIFVIMTMQVDKLDQPQNRLFRFTTLPDKENSSLLFEVWANDYTHALKMAYKYRRTHLKNIDRTNLIRWYKVEELDPISKETIKLILENKPEIAKQKATNRV